MAVRSAKRETADSLGQEIRATLPIWNEGVAATSVSLQDLLAQLNNFAKQLYDSPLGKRAQRHPVASIGIAAVAVLACRRLLRR